MYTLKKYKFLIASVLFSLIGLMGMDSESIATPPPPKECTESTIAFDNNPVTDGDMVDITGTVEESGSSCPGGVAGQAGTPVTVGTIRIDERQVDGDGVSCGTEGLCTAGNVGAVCSVAGVNAACDSSLGAADGFCTLADYVQLASSTPDSNGEISHMFDTTGLGGSTIGFRSHYSATGGADFQGSMSDCMDLVINSATCAEVGVIVGAVLANGNGAPEPGDCGYWQFDINVQNCTGMDLEGVKVQGGSNGWAPVPQTCAENDISGTDSSYCVETSAGMCDIRQNKKNQVITCNMAIRDGDTETIQVLVNGCIKNNLLECGKIKFLNGPWSAVYDTQKSEYSGRISVEVGAAVGSVCE